MGFKKRFLFHITLLFILLGKAPVHQPGGNDVPKDYTLAGEVILVDLQHGVPVHPAVLMDAGEMPGKGNTDGGVEGPEKDWMSMPRALALVDFGKGAVLEVHEVVPDLLPAAAEPDLRSALHKGERVVPAREMKSVGVYS